MKILIFIETDVVVRHFIFSKAFEKINKNHDVVYIFPDGDKRLGSIKSYELNLDGCRRIRLDPCIERLKLWRIRFFVEKLRDKRDVSQSLIKQWRKDFRSGNSLYALIIYRFLGLPFIFKVFTKIVNLFISRTPNIFMKEILHREKPDLIIHPSVLEGNYIDDVIFYGNQFKKPVIVIMNSWDNPLTKRSVVNKDYFLLVWGKQTENHAIQYMGLRKEKVIKFGSAQFDIYNFDKSNKSKYFKNQYKFDLNTKTLLYAGSSKNSDEFSHLLLIDNAINSGLLPKINIIYRPHPWGKCGYKGERFKHYKFDNVIYDLKMKDYIFRDFNKDNSKYLPDLESTKYLLDNVDMVISPLSTILLEAMILGKVPLCLMTEDEDQAEHFHMVKRSPHFSEILSNKNVIVLNSKDGLINGIKKAHEKSNIEEIKIKLKKQSEFFISKFSKPFNIRLLKLVQEIYLEEIY